MFDVEARGGGVAMRTWRHQSHNLKQSTVDRLAMVVAELRAEHNQLSGRRTLSSDEQAERERVERALPLVEAAMEALVH
jgi:hypothetical protein